MAKTREARFDTPIELANAFMELVAMPTSGGASSQAASHKGKATKALGGLAAHDSRGAETGGPLKPGTFSEFESRQPGRQTRQVAPPSLQHDPKPDSQTATRAGRVQAGSHAVAAPSQVPGPEPAKPQAQPAPIGTFPGEPSASVVLPGRRVPWVAITIALVAGALTAAGALYAVRDDSSEPTSPAAAPPHDDPELEEPPPASESDPAGTPRLRLGPPPNRNPELPTGAVPPAVETPQPRSRRRRRRDSRRTDTAMTSTSVATESMESSPPPPFVESAPPTPAASPLQQARDALNQADPERCLEILEQHGLSSAGALRLEADCYLRSGRRADAAKTYERFCELYPTHRTIHAVRSLALAAGGRCP